MLTEHQYDRLERLAVLYDKALEHCAERTAKLRRYVEAQTARDVARERAFGSPHDLNRQETLKRAVEELNQACKEFAQTLRRNRRRR